MARVRTGLVREHLLQAAETATSEDAGVLRAIADSAAIEALTDFGGECYLAKPPSPLHSELGKDGLKMCCEHAPQHCAIVGRLGEAVMPEAEEIA